MSNWDFSGWATKNGIKCADGRTICKDAFKDQDHTEVPLVWMHDHDNPYAVLGHALLENRDEGVYCYCSFNDSDGGKQAKEFVKHGDVKSLSIYANKLKEVGGSVVHGVIRELSLVLAGANPEATIDVVLQHSEGCIDEAIIYCGDNESEISLSHSDKEEKEMAEEKKEEKKPVEQPEAEKKEEKKEASEETVEDVINTMNEKQKTVLYGLVAEAAKKAEKETDDSDEGGKEVKHNAFENDSQDTVIQHDALNKIFKEGKKYGSLKESFIEHAADYGIENIEFLQPEDHDIYDRPQFINNQPTGWVDRIIRGVHNTPFAKIRMVFADITEDEARAKGYIKGKLKKEEVFKLLKRSVAPTTIYKKQKFDRDDLVDADFDVVPWIKQEMELKLDEEKARAYIFGDGRSAADEDKINESNIIPVVNDDDLYAIKATVAPGQGEQIEDVIVDEVMKAMDDYQGSGNTVGFFEQKLVTRIRLIKDQFGHRLYNSDAEVAGAMGLREIVRVPANIMPANTHGVILDLADYNVGMKDAGKKNFFDDFDIDYNQQKYLIETRQSGALTRPYSAVVIKSE